MKAPFTRGFRRVAWFCWLARSSAVAVAVAVITIPSSASAAAGPVPLGTAANFAVLAGSAVTNVGDTVINGDLGLYPAAGVFVTGFPPGRVNGTIYTADSVARQAQADLTTAYNNATARPVSATLPAALGGTTQTAGVYNSITGAFAITGTLTLDAQGNPDAVFIFEASTTFITADASKVVLVNGAQPANVFWVVGTSATLGAGSALQGSILAVAAITVLTGATIYGRALAEGDAVTLDTDTITDFVPAMVIDMTASTSSTAPGDTVDYTITIANTGQTAYTGATVTDSLADVLDDATYNTNSAVASAGTVTFASPNLTWTGDLAVDETVTVTYSVTVNDPVTGNLILASTVSSAAAGNNCLPGSTDPRCSTSVPVIIGVLSITAPGSADLGTAAPGGTASAQFGVVQVSDDRAGVAGWTATVSGTDFITGGGTPAETIPVHDVQYLIAGFTSTTGSATFTPTPATVLSGAARAVVTATNVNGDNSASWNPLIQVLVPGGAVAGNYSGTITHSVS
jgi:uncharacterized repeat protein (TIGR01451 family)